MKTEKSQKIIVISLFALLLVGLMLLGVRLSPALANDFYPDHSDLAETNEPHLINDMATQIAEQPDAEKESRDQEAASNTSTLDAAALLQSMVQDFENNTFSQSGWLHYAYYLESDVPNGVALPQNYYCDGWFLIDETGNVTQHVISYYDNAGNLNQREIYKDLTFINLTTNDKMETEGPYRLKLDLGLTRYMLEMQMEGSILTHEVSAADEKPVVKFSVIGNYDKPTVFGNTSQPVESIRMTTLFDQATGAISEIAYVYLLVDGTEELFYKVQTSTLEWGELPQEFVKLLEDGD
jgi:hypothetical protein